jgi:hypothetical protein
MLPRVMGFRARALGIALLSGCATHASQPLKPVLAPEPTESSPDAAPPDAPADDYAALVRQVVARDGRSDAAEPACLIERIDSRLRFAGHASPALRPLPLPSADLDAQLASSVSVNVLTGFGRYGAAPGTLTLASFSSAIPSREALALVVTNEGVALRGVDARVPLQNRLTRDAAVRAAVLLQPATVFVAAEAAVATSLLAELLTALDSQRVPVALAVDLPSAAALPAAATANIATCPDGLAVGAEPEGDLALAQINPVLAQLRARAGDCLVNADARGAAGGRVRVMLRVMANGAVGDTCISADETGDPRLLACIIAAARGLRFPAPTPTGSVDLELPLALAPSFAPQPPLLCDAELQREGRAQR